MEAENSIPKMQLDLLIKSREAQELCEFPVPVTELLDRFEKVTTPMVNDSLRERNLIYRTLPNGILPLRENYRVAGIAFTVKGSKSLAMQNDMAERVKMLEAIPADSFVIWDTDQDAESTQWGEVITMAAIRRGCRGAAVDGGIRDTDKVLEMKFPVFVKYRNSSGMLGRFRITGWEIPIKIGDVIIYPGDVVFGDIDGVIIIPRAIAYEILLRAEQIRDGETELKRWVREGLSPSAIVERGGYF
jgi:4-hydroxy-4-methyl-2-oxoglutarate aldolase